MQIHRRNLYAVLLIIVLIIVLKLWMPPIDTPVTAAPEKLHPIYAVDTDKKKLSISFDATWGADQTERILNVLDEFGIKTTFFLCGIWIEDYPDMVKEISRRGHEIGNHSTSHPHMNALSREQIKREIMLTHDKIKELTGQAMRLFRPPFGEYNNVVLEEVRGLGYEAIQWSIDSLDWRDLSAEQMQARILPEVKPGSIILFHNAGKHTVAALRPLLGRFADWGYEVVPISSLIYRNEYYIDNEGIQRKK